MSNIIPRFSNLAPFYRVLKEALRKEGGVLDLASIMVGTIVTGLIGGVVASTVFVVIPWTQDNAAKQQLTSIVSAESAYFGLSADPQSSALPAGAVTNAFANSAELKTANLLGIGTTYCVSTPHHKTTYEAYSKSASGNIWLITDTNPVPVAYSGSLPADCLFIVPPYVDPAPKTTTMTYNCDVTTTGAIPIYNQTGKETWNDGVTQTYSGLTAPVSRTLAAGITYQMTFIGTYYGLNGQYSPEVLSLGTCLVSVDHLGMSTGVTDASFAFYKANKLVSVPERIPSTIQKMSFMFNGATKFNDPSISKWNVSNVTTMDNMFYGATIFNQPLNHWNTSKVTTMGSMFVLTSNFNQPLDNWDVSSLTDMAQMFSFATNFNQPLNNWNVSKITSMRNMFHSASNFDQPLDNWNVGNVTDMHEMFSSASKFNQPLSSWNTSKVTNMTATFLYASAFNQNISMWSLAGNPSGTYFRTASALTAANSPFGV